MRILGRKKREKRPSSESATSRNVIVSVSDKRDERYRARMASIERELEVWRAAGNVAGYEVFAAPNSCDYCQQRDGEIFAIDVPPTIPHKACTRENGCRCILSPILAEDWERRTNENLSQ